MEAAPVLGAVTRWLEIAVEDSLANVWLTDVRGNVRTFWVNQGQTYREELGARVLWAPKLSRPKEGDEVGTPRSHWERMTEARPGDVVLHYSRGAVRAWSAVLSTAFDSAPPFEDPTTRWSDDGRVLRVEVQELDAPIALDDIPLDLRTERDATSWPFTKTGTVKQVYLSEVGGTLAEWLLDEVGLLQDVAQAPTWPAEGAETPIDYRGDRRVVVAVRVEQPQLRRRLFGTAETAQCALCGRELPVAMLITAHIKRRADTTAAERRRTDTVMPACRLGCDSLFELGYVVVSTGGMIEQGPRRSPMTDALERDIVSLVGKKCPYWDPSTERYFAHHRRFQAAEVRQFDLA